MDSRNIPTQSSGYMGLLNSQQGNNYDGNFPYESYHTSVQFHPFSSQQADIPSPSEDTPVDRKERRRWTPADDEVLISAWLNTSKGNFWKRVGEYYAASPHGSEVGERREPDHCKKRWHRINDMTNKFCAAYAAAERQLSSGQSDTDLLKMAHDIFFSDQNSKFNLEHAWCVLRYEQKWLSLNTPKPGGCSKRKNSESGSEPASPHPSALEIRPEGVKAAKAKRNSGKEKSVAEYTTIWEMKKEDLAMKEKLSKLAILDTLLAKTNPLSEAEEVVKNKLLALYF
ncbi:hypothetical protein Bca4012_084337 [Brassica carinata]